MAPTSDDTPSVDRQQLYVDLHATITQHRGGNHPERIAEHLLRVDCERELVALLDDTERAVIHNPRADTLTVHAVNQHGLRDQPPGDALAPV